MFSLKNRRVLLQQLIYSSNFFGLILSFGHSSDLVLLTLSPSVVTRSGFIFCGFIALYVG